MGSVLSSLWQEGHNPNIRHLGRESWNWLPAQPEPKIATYLQSIIESLRFYSPGSFNSQLPSLLLTISVVKYNIKQTGQATSSHSVAHDGKSHRMKCANYSKAAQSAFPQVFPHSFILLPPKTGSLSSQEKYWPSTLPTLWFPETAGRKLPNLIKVVT